MNEKIFRVQADYLRLTEYKFLSLHKCHLCENSSCNWKYTLKGHMGCVKWKTNIQKVYFVRNSVKYTVLILLRREIVTTKLSWNPNSFRGIQLSNRIPIFFWNRKGMSIWQFHNSTVSIHLLETSQSNLIWMISLIRVLYRM